MTFEIIIGIICRYSGDYDHEVTFTQDCAGSTVIYDEVLKTCVDSGSNDRYEDGTVHQCWTNDDCSIEATFSDYGNWRTLLIIGVCCDGIAAILLVFMIYFSYPICKRDPSQWNKLCCLVWWTPSLAICGWPIVFLCCPNSIYGDNDYKFQGGPPEPEYTNS